ncbi:methionine ABC transporter ATP-binding protein [Sporolactobacillus spathodeae]|uniref:D-methionine transport system ATP-binding protein n=1 Tax=Sporolactobacillus spathodeae TaxID=1465502 RepID=A0ABS2Q5L5_9BACL|nr:ATP-binding cassette domain-containing protein [Sporolactobacillus spathodeae]MBM7656600.1 D-methionine transport system ATP-binding protein [Sporolactobacillus spathodeae]
MIELIEVGKTYETKDGSVIALENINLTIQNGEIFGIIGYSGAGKSTLIRLINLLERPSKGRLIVDNRDMLQLGERELRDARKQIGMIFQHFNLLWSRNVAQNIALPLELAGVHHKARDARVSELLALVGLEGRGKAYPSQLSGGQKQRVGIARALASRPKILLCDEATSALDPKTTESILQLLREINRKLGITIVIITHEMKVISSTCHRVAVLDKGIIVESGAVSEVFGHPKQEITREFVGKTGLPLEQIRKPKHVLLRAVFRSSTAQRAIITELARSEQLFGRIVQAETFGDDGGSIVLETGADNEAIQHAVAALRAKDVLIEVLNG